MPSISIITINYNDLNGLKRTLKSVQEQTVKDFEHIIIDGNSSDGSKELIQKTKDNYSYWVSEPDKGIYDAMNKGIAQANGNYILFLNSGDTLFKNDVLNEVQPYLDNTTDLVYGDLFIIGENKPNFIIRYPKLLDFNFFQDSSLGHPATFIKRELFDLYGTYRTDLRIVSDWEFFLKVISIEKVSYKKMDLIISNFYQGGISTSASNAENHKAELKKVLLEYFDIYKTEFNKLIAIDKEKSRIYSKINPQIKMLTTNKFLLRILNRSIDFLSFILKTKRSL